jgi:hypothetical protein
MDRRFVLRAVAFAVAAGSLGGLFTFNEAFRDLGADVLKYKLNAGALLGNERVLPPVDFRIGDASKVKFLESTDSGPTGLWDPCREINLSINPKYEPTGFRKVFEEQLIWASSRTGLSIRLNKETLEEPAIDRSPMEGSSWKDVLVAFLPEKDFLKLANQLGYIDRTIGLGGPDTFTVNGDEQNLVAVSGILYFNSTWIEDELNTGNVEEGFGREIPPLIQHEIGHLLGLDHFGNGLMSADGLSSTINPAVLNGFARTGQGPCYSGTSYPNPLEFSAIPRPTSTPDGKEQTIDYLMESAERSYKKLGTEAVTEFLGDWIVINAPGFTEHYSSAQFRGPEDKGSLVMHVSSNIYWVWQMLQEADVRIAPSEGGFYVSHPNFTEIYVELGDGLIVKSTVIETGVESVHKYEALEPYLSRLLVLEEQVVSQW